MAQQRAQDLLVFALQRLIVEEDQDTPQSCGRVGGAAFERVVVIGQGLLKVAADASQVALEGGPARAARDGRAQRGLLASGGGFEVAARQLQLGAQERELRVGTAEVFVSVEQSERGALSILQAVPA